MSALNPDADPATQPDPDAAPPADPAATDPKPADPVDWKTTLGEHASHEKISGFDSPQALAKAYIDFPDQAVVPKPEEYKFPEGTVPPDFGQLAHDQGLTQGQADALIAWETASAEKREATADTARTEGLNNLLAEWGDSKDTNLSIAQSTLKQYDTDGAMIKLLEAAGESDNPTIVKFLYTVGLTLKEGNFLKSLTNTDPANRSPEDVLYPKQNST